MNNSIDLTGPISFGKTFSYSFRFLKKNYLKMLPFLALFFLPTLIIFIAAAYPCFTRLIQILKEFNQIINEYYPNIYSPEMHAQLNKWTFGPVAEFIRFITPLLLISLFSIVLSISAVLEMIKKSVENRTETFKETFNAIFKNYIPFLASTAGAFMIISFIAFLAQIYSLPILLYTIALLFFLPALSYFGNRGVSQSVGASFILSRKKLFFLFGFTTLTFIIFSLLSQILGLIGSSLSHVIIRVLTDSETLNNSTPELFTIKSQSIDFLVFCIIQLISVQFLLIPFASLASSIHYFSLRHQFPDLKLDRRSNVEMHEEIKEEFLPDSIPL